jgi:rhomboid protease GluP
MDLEDMSISSEQFNSIMQQLYRGFSEAGVHIREHVIFICAGDRKYISDLVIGFERHEHIQQAIGIVDTSRNMIMMEEDASERWSQLCVDISMFLNRLAAMYEAHNPVPQKTIGQEIKTNLKYSTIWIAVVNVLIFIGMTFLGIDKYNEIVNDFASNYRIVLDKGEWYRIFTAMFLHADADHLIGNMLSLCVIGLFVEKAMGRVKFVIAYFATGIIAGLVSMGYNMYLGDNVYSLGASGAVYGLIGVFIVILIADKGETYRINVTRMIIYLVLCGYATMTESNIDHAAHIGGLIAGLVLGIIMFGIPRVINRNKQVNRYED